jgi:hypothetical protein
MDKIINRTEKALSFIKAYIVPIVIVIVSVSVAWAVLRNAVTDNAFAIEELEVRCEKNEEMTQLILQRLSSIDTNLEYIKKAVERLDEK